jgi:hypothetical protein
MGKFKDQGDPVLALAEECAELIQVINKKYRFCGDSLNAWNGIPTGKTESRLESLLSEIADVQYQIARTLEVVRGEHDDYHDSGSNSHFDTRNLMSFFKGGNIEDCFQEEMYKEWEEDEMDRIDDFY